MNMKINHIVISTLAMLVMSCGTRKAEQFQALPFPDVALPEMLQDPMDRAEYKAEHWWDRLTDEERTYPSDSALVSGVSREAVEQNFANWVNILSMIDYVPASKSVRRLYDKINELSKTEYSDLPIRLMEPIAPKIARFNEKYRYNLLVKTKNGKRLYSLLDEINMFFTNELRSELSINVNPMSNV